MPSPESLAVVEFDSRVFSLEIIKKAAYRYIDRFAPSITINGESIVCHLKFAHNQTPSEAEELIDEFKKEVLDQDLRLSVAEESKPYRDTILALAFSSTNLVSHE